MGDVKMQTPIKRPDSRKATALLICLFVMTISAMSLLGLLGSVTSQMAAQRNTIQFEKALYLAGAAVHHAIAELEEDASWTDGIPNTPSTGNEYYSATVTTQSGSQILITGIGTVNDIARTLEVVVEFSG